MPYQENSFECCKGKLFCLDECFVLYDTKRWKLFKRIKSSLSDRESKNESFFGKRVLRLIEMFSRYCENRKRIIYSETSDMLSWTCIASGKFVCTQIIIVIVTVVISVHQSLKKKNNRK